MAGNITTSDITTDIGSVVATILSGQSLSAAVDLKASRAHQLIMPATLDVGSITFQVSADGTTYVNLYDSAGEFAIPSAVVGVSRSILLDIPTFFGIRYLKVRTGSAASPQVQSGDRAITISTIPR